MGQYYKPIFLNDKNEPQVTACSWDFNNGAKLMEHSYVRNRFMHFAEMGLFYNKRKLVWAGDYADEEEGKEEGMNLYVIANEMIEKGIIKNIDSADVPELEVCENALAGTFVINHTKKVYYKRPDYVEGEWVINPLSLLTCEGNGRGGGDYEGTEMESIGTWARDLIEISDTVPDGYTEKTFNFKEEY